jgi:hypothetical protein
MLRTCVFCLSLLLMSVVRAECLLVADAGVEIDEGETGAGELHWHARLENRCDRDQDAMLTVRFLDADGRVVYEVQDQLIVMRHGEHDAGRKIYVPAMYLDEIEAIDIELEARERPF